MKIPLIISEMKHEREKLAKEREELLKRVDHLTSNIALLDKYCGNGSREPTPRLIDAAAQIMKSMKRFTKGQLAERVKHEYSALDFNVKSIGKPLSVAIKTGKVKLIQPNLGSKTQAVYEWIADP